MSVEFQSLPIAIIDDQQSFSSPFHFGSPATKAGRSRFEQAVQWTIELLYNWSEMQRKYRTLQFKYFFIKLKISRFRNTLHFHRPPHHARHPINRSQSWIVIGEILQQQPILTFDLILCDDNKLQRAGRFCALLLFSCWFIETNLCFEQFFMSSYGEARPCTIAVHEQPSGGCTKGELWSIWEIVSYGIFNYFSAYFNFRCSRAHRSERRRRKTVYMVIYEMLIKFPMAQRRAFPNVLIFSRLPRTLKSRLVISSPAITIWWIQRTIKAANAHAQQTRFHTQIPHDSRFPHFRACLITANCTIV